MKLSDSQRVQVSMYDLSSDGINLSNLHHFKFGIILYTKLSAVSGKILKGFPENINLT